jgi:hypothetical protein
VSNNIQDPPKYEQEYTSEELLILKTKEDWEQEREGVWEEDSDRDLYRNN